MMPKICVNETRKAKCLWKLGNRYMGVHEISVFVDVWIVCNER